MTSLHFKVASVPLACMSTAAVGDRIAGALWGAFIADAMAMPTHWYYGGPRQVRDDFGGPITTYTTAVTAQGKRSSSNSIMALSNTGGAGRGSDKGDIIGDVINHGKKKYWARDQNYHYHHTLQKGENTLEAQLMRLMMRSIVSNHGVFDQTRFREEYVEYMTTPGSHNDSYASTCHRMFFKNRQEGRPLSECPDNDHHNVDTIDAFDLPLVVALATAMQATETASEAVVAAAMATRSLSRRVQVCIFRVCSSLLPCPLLLLTVLTSCCRLQGLGAPFAGFYRSIVVQGSSPAQAAQDFASALGLDLAAHAYRGEDPLTA